ncbi:thiol:disulfide interchange protein DsbD [Modicisalibacter ilicicola DSM 19980]|uniref:Thiol:disulfide interchange protein DsbD n=1 Tax=Modicisalibacter ilicicola DSM 19980 TaxID=1121942 RepID=A0A1M4WAV3_9GAMM|nr:protein-disulfide reductase DsbD [Halomonas ilicicola]SHE78398.1 thiol:disulfide interchange protein DsbD [Halomonas ilicicola DSM 19980]
MPDTVLPRFVARLLLLLLALLSTGALAAGQDFLPVDKAFKLHAEKQEGEVVLRWEIAPGYYLYRKRLGIEGEPSAIAPFSLREGEVITDEYFGESEVYYDELEVRVAPRQAERLALTWQGCAEDGLCYAPQRDKLDLASMSLENGTLAGGGFFSSLSGSGSGSGPSSPAVSEADPPPREQVRESDFGEDQRLASSLADADVGWALAAFFGMGLLLTFTPCVLPMVPILSSLVVGSGASTRRGLMLSLAFVLPMALTYAAIGVIAALAGANLQAMLQTPWVLGSFALIFVVLALAMFGLFELQLPSALRQRLDSLQQHQRGGTLGGAAAMGVLSAVLVGPCMTAPLAGALLYIADSGDALLGGAALLALGLGMGAPLLLVGALGARLLPRPGEWMTRVKVLFGFVLLGMAIWFIARVVPDSVELGLWGLLLVGIAVALWQMSISNAPTPAQLIARTAGLALGLWGAVMIVGSAGGGDDPYRPLAFLQQTGGGGAPIQEEFMTRFEDVENLGELSGRVEQAGAGGQWTLVDVYADWCISCKVIEEEVFGDPRVQAELTNMQLLRPDVTENDAADQAMLKAYGILGPPTIMLIGPDGNERRGQRIVGEIGAEEFLERLEQAREGARSAS